jgi:hypothetical protein
VDKPLLGEVLPALGREIETGLRKAGRDDLAATVGGLRVHRCRMPYSGGAWLFTTTKTLTAAEAQLLRRDKSVSADDLQRRLELGYTWPPDETVVLPDVRVCVWHGTIEQLCVARPGMHRPTLRRLAAQTDTA